MTAGGSRKARVPWRYTLYCAAWQVLDWLFPPQCVVCGEWGAWLCEDCQARVEHLEPPLCDRCGQPLDEPDTTLCSRCRREPLPLTQARALAPMRGVAREALHHLKYRKAMGVALPLAEALADLVHRMAWPVEAVAPVPLGAQRLVERGYNQAALLAYPLALRLGVRYAGATLHRVRETRSQVGLTAVERRENVRGAFRAQAPLPAKRWLLVDDVMTTGATLAAAAEALLEAGAEQVWAVTVAQAVLGADDAQALDAAS